MSFKITTNKNKKKYFDALIFKDEDEFKERLEELKWDEDVKIDFKGTTKELLVQDGSLVEGARIEFFLEGRGQLKGKLVSFKPIPFIEVEDREGNHYGVLKSNIKSLIPTFSELSKKYVREVSTGRFRRYEIGIISIGKLWTFKTAEESMKNLCLKGDYIILLERKIK